jgi:hypothetical protein
MNDPQAKYITGVNKVLSLLRLLGSPEHQGQTVAKVSQYTSASQASRASV